MEHATTSIATRPTITPDLSGRTTRTSDSRAVYSVREVARLLSLSLGSTYALVREGEIPARKLGGRWVIPKKRFHEWLNEATELTQVPGGWA
ncbi:helix-turn-helix domain-containing protein [Micromonospora sp. NPDC005367]|uniref:helix-turn-helix domain-containing protein n=1 Tax=Micromonospora sp. NPDC005367 TaxID=3155590 RepID=UPI0033B4A52A